MMGGSKENRHTPATDHWSIAVKDGKVLEKEWQTEIPIPRGGPHRFPSFTSSVYLYTFGGVYLRHVFKPIRCLTDMAQVIAFFMT